MKRLTILLAGVSLFASVAVAGSVSNVPGTLDTTVVDPAPALYPHFICASGCNGGSSGGAVSQSGAWSVGVNNFPAIQAISGTVNIGTSVGFGGAGSPSPYVETVQGVTGGAPLAVSQSGGWSIGVNNFPAIQAISGTVNIGSSAGFGGVGSPSPYVETVQGATGGAPLAVSEIDGADATLGSKADVASATGIASVVAILKQLHLDSIGAIPAGVNTIGSVNIGAQTIFNTPVVSATLESSHVFKATAGQLTSAYVVSTVAGYLMLLNATSAPSDGAVFPQECVSVPANVATGVAFAGLPPESYSVGITAVFSTTGCFTKTASATAYFHGAVQ